MTTQSHQQFQDILQSNCNHSARAQDLLLQVITEWNISVAVVAEPYFIPQQSNWVGSLDQTVALIASSTTGSCPFIATERGQGYALAKWGNITIVGVYFSPNKPLVAFELFLSELSCVLRRTIPTQIIVLGDFNAKCTSWGSPITDPRGAALIDWTVAMGLEVLNRGNINTCVRRNGGSIVDVSFASPITATRILNWRVLEDTETLSDHRYIRMKISTNLTNTLSLSNKRTSVFPKWSLNQLDQDMAGEAAMVEAWNIQPPATIDIEEKAIRFGKSLTTICDAAMPRARRLPNKQSKYWWTQEIASLRHACNRARRKYTRCRRRRHTTEEEETHYKTLLDAKRSLTNAIVRSKNESREEFLATLDRDPWGRPYKLVRNKLKHAPPIDCMEPEILNKIIEGLFPQVSSFTPPHMTTLTEDFNRLTDIPSISDEEWGKMTERLQYCRKAPGPDGVPGKVLLLALEHLGDCFRSLLQDCLKEGCFPKCWKIGKLCLIRKENRPPDSYTGYRPLVMLNETGKMLERILAYRISEHLQNKGPNVSDRQFGFREGLSTIDAINCLKNFNDYASGRGEGVVAISLDIANAFGTLPYTVIEEALRYHDLPLYLRRILNNYLTERTILYEYKGIQKSIIMTCGVPQGSVLGPLLWNIGYDWAIRGAQLPRMITICYADDTLVAVRGKDITETIRRATVATELTIDRIKRLGLKVALSKTEAIIFGGQSWSVRANHTAVINVTGVPIHIKTHIKYLGLILDRKWDFREHFTRLTPRIVGTASALGRLLPNIGGPKTTCRRLFAGVVRSMALYGAPIWANRLSENNKSLLRRPQRLIALRIIRAYNTVSHAASCLLACTPPWELDAVIHAERHQRKMEARARGENWNLEEIKRAQQLAEEQLKERWMCSLRMSQYGTRTIEAILPIFENWIDRKHGTMTYRLTQIMTGHGCFGHYLYKINREPNPGCHECGDADDTVEHTVEICTKWDSDRQILLQYIGDGTLSLKRIVPLMVSSDRIWKMFASFCDNIIKQKESAEREREEDPNAHLIRRKRRGRARRQYAAHIIN